MHDLPDVQRALNAACRNDLQAFVERSFHTLDPGTELESAPYLEVLCDHFEQVARGEIKRLLVTIPPRHLKTIAGSIALPAWVLGRDPSKRIMTLSYGQDLSAKFASQFRQIMRSAWYAHVFPQTAASITRDTATELRTRQNGSRLATSLGGTITGLGADIIIIDDLMKSDDVRSPVARQRVQEFYGGTLLSRLNDKSTGSIIAIQQRLHEDDLAGHLIQLGGFVHLNLPAIAEEAQTYTMSSGRVFRRQKGDVLKPRTEPRQVLDDMRKDMGGPIFQAQYQQNPTAFDSALIQWDRIQTYDERPPRDEIQCVAQSWDAALSNTPYAAFSVGTTWGWDGYSWLLLDLVRARLDYHELLARVRQERKRWRADTIIIEKAALGIQLLGDVARDFRCLSEPQHHAPWCARIAVTPTTGKEERLAAQVERLYSGHARLPTDAPWLPELKRELLGFPSTTYDDQVDSVSQFLEWSVSGNARSTIERSDPRGPWRR